MVNLKMHLLCLWNNKHIKIAGKSVYFRYLSDLGIHYVKDLIDNKGKFKVSNVLMIPQPKIFYWLMLKHSIKKEWIQKIQNETTARVTPERMYLPLKE